MIGLVMLAVAVSSRPTITGNDLLALCISDRAECLRYVQGVSDTASLLQRKGATARLICENDATVTQLADIVIKFLLEHPAIRDEGAAGSAWSALYATFPCRK